MLPQPGAIKEPVQGETCDRGTVLASSSHLSLLHRRAVRHQRTARLDIISSAVGASLTGATKVEHRGAGKGRPDRGCWVDDEVQPLLVCVSVLPSGLGLLYTCSVAPARALRVLLLSISTGGR